LATNGRNQLAWGVKLWFFAQFEREEKKTIFYWGKESMLIKTPYCSRARDLSGGKRMKRNC